MSWAAIIPQILGTAANHYQGIRNTLEAPARKRRFLSDAAHDAQVTALRNQRHTDFFPTNAIDARYKADQVRREARENPAFAADPAAFMPFIQSASQLSGSLYDEFNKSGGGDYQGAVSGALKQPPASQIRDAPKIPEPSHLQYFERAQPERMLAYDDRYRDWWQV